jgi:AcrR family transcriptional regulator
VPIVETDPIGQRAPWPSSRPGTSVAPAKRRILETANRLFYDEGIRSVGIDRLISESGVTKATFYKHYGSKDRLIVEYITQRHVLVKDAVDEIIATASDPVAATRAIVNGIVADVVAPEFRGCPFINAAMEFTDSRHAVRIIVSDHREWYADVLADLLRSIGHPLPGDGGDELVLARDGAMTGGYASDPIAATTAFVRATDRILAAGRS